MNIIIKPHHLLDIFKLYGKGYEVFVPDEKYNHNFYYIGNAIITNNVDRIQFTYEFDDICKPCYYLKNDICIDNFYYNTVSYKKNDYNEKVDIRLMRYFDLKFGKVYYLDDMVQLIYDNLNLELINLSWRNCCKEDNQLRYHYTNKGLEKFIQKYY